ncbi:MAG: RNA-guided endonuclease IscB [Solobacterium sp.]|nr:RNA-guided endonuclease IscB [Solobacterium sp.]
MVYVLNQGGQPLMPTTRYGKVRRMLKSGEAKVVKRCPFTIQLMYGTTSYTQPVTLGVDAGSKHIGISACTEKKEVYSEKLTPRNDVVKLLSARREFRRSRRNRNTRYRAPRFNDRVRSKNKGWLAPSVEVKIQEHITAIKHVCAILPITAVRVETAEFDTQRLRAMEEGRPLPVGTVYQMGEMYDEYNVRQYVLRRDNYTCQCCGCTSTEQKPVKFHVHHIESRQTGGDSPKNLVTLCLECHKAVHEGTKKLDGKKRGHSLRDAAFMGIMRKTLVARLREQLDVPVTETYGFITKLHREQNNIEKSHRADARCIAGGWSARPCAEYYQSRAVRHHNRQIHKATIGKGGNRKRNQAPYFVKGFRLFDKVRYQGAECFITGRRSSGYFMLKTIDWKKVTDSVNCGKLKFIGTACSYLREREESQVGTAHSSSSEVSISGGVSCA